MNYLSITGGNPLSGEISVNGSKNAAVALIPAAICAKAECVIENLPPIDDVFKFVDVLEKLGVKREWIDRTTIRLDTSEIQHFRADFDAVREIRASYYLVGALLGLYGRAEIALPGGCNLGSRPYDLHIKGFTALGAEVAVEHGIIKASADKLTGATIYLDIASVGATINIMLAAVFAEGTTLIENPAKEPHVVDVANFLNSMGASVKGAGTDEIKIAGVGRGGLTAPKEPYALIPDQIEAGTFMIAAAATGGDVIVRDLIPRHMEPLSAKLREMGCLVEEGDEYIRVASSGKLNAVNVKTMFYPGFPTDLQPQMCALLSLANGTSIITEAVHENRYQYVNELKRVGVDVTVEGRAAIIKGPANLTGAQVTATDLRAGAALVIAGLAAKDVTTIGNVKYIDRGYEQIDLKLRSLGADIKRVEQ